jgi:hypothetical protein
MNKLLKINLAIILCYFAAVPTLLFADTILPTDSNIRYVGRFDQSNPLAPRMYWSGTHIIAWFEGTSCQVKLNCASGQDYFIIIIDDDDPVKYDLATGLQTIDAASGLTDGFHRIEIFKQTSFKYDNTAFEGFITDAGKGLAALPPAPAVKIQMYGDSITDGNSVDAVGDDTSLGSDWNNYLTYGAVTARNLDMEYVCTAGTGLALLYPWSVSFSDVDYIMDNYYDRIVPNGGTDSSNEWDFSNDNPDIVVVNLLQNDRANQKEPHTEEVSTALIDAYEDLIVKLRAAHPDAEIICALGPMSAVYYQPWPSYVEAAVARMNDNHGDSKVHTLFFPYISGGHPDVAGHLVMANQLTDYIQSNFSYLFDRDTDNDGVIDIDEVDQGTDPYDQSSYFTLKIDSESPVSETMKLVWPSRVGVGYRLWESSTLTDWAVTQNWSDAQTPPEDSLEIPLATKGFFKIESVTP